MQLSLCLTLDAFKQRLSSSVSPFLTNAPWFRMKQPPCYHDMPYSVKKYSPLSLDGAFEVEIDRELGSGATGSIILATHKLSGNRVAVKRFLRDDNAMKDFRHELASLRVLRGHPNIVQLVDHFEEKVSTLVLELAEHGDLHSYVETHGPLTEEAAKHVMFQLLKAVQACHAKKIMHRDIKLGNILVTAIDGEKLTVKLADFGFSAKSHHPLKRYCGTHGYMAPEIQAKKSYGHSIDIWSLGATMHHFLTRQLPDNGNLNIHQLSAVGQDFLTQMLQMDPKKRATASHLLKHLWLMDQTALDQFIHNFRNFILQNYETMSLLCGTDQMDSTAKCLSSVADCLSVENLDTNQLDDLIAQVHATLLALEKDIPSLRKELATVL